MAKNGKTSLKDVATAVGVSPALVSMVLNGKARQYRIGKEVAKKVQAVAAQMNYAPNVTAQILRSGKSQLIGLIVTDVANPFYANIARIIEDRAKRENYTVLISSSDEDPDNTSRLIDVMKNKGVEGLIVVPCDGIRDTMETLARESFPVVLLDRYFPDIDISSSCLDNVRATMLATQHLIAQGYRKIALIAYDTQMFHIIDRISGYQAAMRQAGYEVYEDVRKVDIKNPEPDMRHILDEMTGAQHTEAVIFLTNMLTIHGLSYLSTKNVSIPHDLAVVGFNRNVVFDLYHPQITFIKQPLQKIAEGAFSTLMNHINNEPAVKKGFFEPDLIIRESSLKT